MIAGTSHEEISCCAEGCGDEENERKDAGSIPENCNPFQSCCPGFNVQNTTADFFLQILVFTTYVEREESVPHYQNSDFWQPPRLVTI